MASDIQQSQRSHMSGISHRLHADGRKRLTIYLSDHHAAAQAGEQLASRCAASNQDNDLGTFIDETLLPAIHLDQDVLREAFEAVDADPSTLKDLAARAAELIGRTKLNGQLTGYSPLSRIVEIEGLIAGVTAKRRLWVALAALREQPGYAALPDVSSRIDAAGEHVDALERHHSAAVDLAFTDTKATETN